jgi:hypothetical protein
VTDENAPACSLDAAALAERRGAWLAVNESRVEWRREGGGSTSLYAVRPGLADELQRLVDLERDCCSFLTFRLRQDGERLRLDVEAPDGSPDLLGAF